MSTRHLFGFGGVKLQIGTAGRSCHFPNASGTLAFEPVNIVNETLSFDERYQFAGYRVLITMEIFNTCANEFDEFAKLPEILNDMTAGFPLTVYPHFDVDNQNLGYICRTNSPFYPEQLARTKVGQKVILEFRSVSLVNSLPSLASDPSEAYLMTEDGDYICTEDGDRITVPI